MCEAHVSCITVRKGNSEAFFTAEDQVIRKIKSEHREMS